MQFQHLCTTDNYGWIFSESILRQLLPVLYPFQHACHNIPFVPGITVVSSFIFAVLYRAVLCSEIVLCRMKLKLLKLLTKLTSRLSNILTNQLKRGIVMTLADDSILICGRVNNHCRDLGYTISLFWLYITFLIWLSTI